MKTEYDEVKKELTVFLDGEIDHHCAVDIRNEIDTQIEKCSPKKLILDYGEVTFMDSSGIGLIMGRYRKMQAISGEIEVKNVSSKMYKVIKLSGIEKLGKVSVKDIGGSR